MCDAAVVGAADILERMLEAVPVDVRQRLVAADCDVAIIGRKQVSSFLLSSWAIRYYARLVYGCCQAMAVMWDGGWSVDCQ